MTEFSIRQGFPRVPRRLLTGNLVWAPIGEIGLAPVFIGHGHNSRLLNSGVDS